MSFSMPLRLLLLLVLVCLLQSFPVPVLVQQPGQDKKSAFYFPKIKKEKSLDTKVQNANRVCCDF
jgi:hypothetical protein